MSDLSPLKGFIVNHKVWSAVIAVVLLGGVANAISSPEEESPVPVAAPSTETPAPTTSTVTPTTEPSPEPTEYPMPDVVGMVPDKAKSQVNEALPYDWDVSITVQASWADNANGTVLASKPAKGKPVQDGDTIVLKAVYPLMPNFVGKAPSSAANLERLGFDVRVKKEVGTPVGKVIAQQPQTGAKILPGKTTIVITVGKTAPLTLSQENAIEMALNYLDTMPFSLSGLIDQLEFEGFSNADATFAVGHISVNWNEQAAKMAKNYLDTMPFSRAGLIDQLVFEGFTYAQATYGVNQAGL